MTFKLSCPAAETPEGLARIQKAIEASALADAKCRRLLDEVFMAGYVPLGTFHALVKSALHASRMANEEMFRSFANRGGQ